MNFYEDIYSNLLNYRQINPNFKFLPRQRNNNGKLDKGYWFQGNDDYAFVGLLDRSGGINKTRSLGLVFWPVEDHLECSFELVYKGEQDAEILELYDKLKRYFNNFIEKEKEKFYLYLGDTSNGFEVVFNFLDAHYENIIEIFKNGNRNDVIINDNKFKKLTDKIDSLRASKKTINSYWIFQGNPKVFDFESALHDNTLNNFTVSAHKDKIKVGDKVIIWLSGQQAGCYALAEVTSSPKKVDSSTDDKHWKVEETSETKAGIKITHNLFKDPIRWEDIKDLETFADFKAGNQGTNFSATKKEYETLLNMAQNNRYSWVKTHKQLSQFLLDKENKQQELIEILSSAGATLFNDQNPIGNIIPLEEIDPFTFYCYIYKYGSENRLEILQNIAKALDLFVPDDDSGIPSTNAQKVWLFPYKHDRTNNEIERLWNLFYSTLNKTLTDDMFVDVLKIKGVGKTKLTEALFYADPENYFPINGPTKPYLKEVLALDPGFSTYLEYQNILEQIKTKTDKPFYQISYEAWLWNDKNKSNSNDDFNLLINKIKPSLEEAGFKLDRIHDRYAWIIDPFGLIGSKEAHYELICRRDEVFLELHFESKKTHRKFKSILGALKEPLTWFKWYGEGYSISYGQYSFDELQIEQKLIEGIHDFDRLIGNQIRNILKGMNASNKIEDIMRLNKILFGPPGTGKTYNTINEALQIVDPGFYNDNKENRDALNNRFKELLIRNWEKTNGQIAFCTFHQSFSYEDFVEGIKPKVNENKDIYYKIEDGVFKRICQLADSSISATKMKEEGKFSWDEEHYSRASFYKLSLGNSSLTDDRAIYDYCVENNVISVGFGGEYDFSGMGESEILKKGEELEMPHGDIQRLNYFINYLKKGNYVVISNGTKYVRGLGKVVGDYQYNEESPISYPHFREVEWIFVDENIPVNEIYDSNFNQKTIYKLDESRLKKEFFVNQASVSKMPDKKVKDYVLIIDEINRGNVSSIFGELITLIEPDKRAGRDEELEVTLPYSKEPFKVPYNVHIIGTMNTADKSIESLDTALRRRFSFVEMPPKPKLIEKESLSGTVNGNVDGIDLKKLLEKINKRIEKLIDKDHKIGHSYFLKVHDKASLVNCFKNEVIPLLEEYFYGDYGKIGLVLGNSFVVKEENDSFEFAEFEGYDPDVASDLKERSVYKISKSVNWNFKAI